MRPGAEETATAGSPASGPELARSYGELILQEAPRVLGLMDRERLSPTVGCCDRTYWAWKFTDFPGARFQESLCTLAFLYSTALPGSSYQGSERLLEWIEWGLDFWCRLQYPDGSFDEAYPHERSLAATAFTSFYIAETLGFLADDLAEESRRRVIAALERAGRWLSKNDETHGVLSNHLAAAAAALHHVHLLTDDPGYLARSRYFVDRILEHQSTEGWYEEYGGADPGYQTHGSFYLVRLWQLSAEDRLRTSLASAMHFLAHFIHPDGSLGGEYASRNTKTYYPAAFETWRTEDAAAAWIAERMRGVVGEAAAVGLRAVDAYNYFPMLNNLVFSFCALRGAGKAPVAAREPSPETGLVWFPEAGMARLRTRSLDTWVGTAKGGVVLVFDRRSRRLLLRDCGYVGRLRDGRVIASQYQDPERRVSVAEERIVVEGRFCEVTRPVFTPFRFLGFRLFSLTLGRIAPLAHWLKRLLVRVLIYKRSELDIRFERILEIDADQLAVRDRLAGGAGLEVEALFWEPCFATVHMGSSRYFVESELGGPAAVHLDSSELAAGIRLDRRVSAPSPGVPRE